MQAFTSILMGIEEEYTLDYAKEILTLKEFQDHFIN